MIDNKIVYLGIFDEEEEAACAYDRMSIRCKIHGKTKHGGYKLNFDSSNYAGEEAALTGVDTMQAMVKEIREVAACAGGTAVSGVVAVAGAARVSNTASTAAAAAIGAEAVVPTTAPTAGAGTAATVAATTVATVTDDSAAILCHPAASATSRVAAAEGTAEPPAPAKAGNTTDAICNKKRPREGGAESVEGGSGGGGDNKRDSKRPLIGKEHRGLAGCENKETLDPAPAASTSHTATLAAASTPLIVPLDPAATSTIPAAISLAGVTTIAIASNFASPTAPVAAVAPAASVAAAPAVTAPAAAAAAPAAAAALGAGIPASLDDVITRKIRCKSCKIKMIVKLKWTGKVERFKCPNAECGITLVMPLKMFDRA